MLKKFVSNCRQRETNLNRLFSKKYLGNLLKNPTKQIINDMFQKVYFVKQGGRDRYAEKNSNDARVI